MSRFPYYPSGNETDTGYGPYSDSMYNIDTDDVTDTTMVSHISQISTNTLDQNCGCNQADDDRIQDMVLVDGNERDLQICGDEDELMERVWRLSRPPIIPKQTCTVSARRVQVTRERLSAAVKKIPPLSEMLRKQVERNIKTERKATEVKYEPIYERDESMDTSCPEISSPICTHTFAELL